MADQKECGFIDLVGKRIVPDELEILYSEPFSEETLTRDFDIRGGEWTVSDGWLTGKNPENDVKMIISRAEYFGDVFLDFRARTVLPSTHDICVMWNGQWDYETNQQGASYVAAVAGWWDGKVGVEKSPDFTFNALSGLFSFEPGRIYHIQCGCVDGVAFLVIDGKLAIEVNDPDPIDTSTHGLIGFEAYASTSQITDLKIKRAVYTPIHKEYPPEF